MCLLKLISSDVNKRQGYSVVEAEATVLRLYKVKLIEIIKKK